MEDETVRSDRECAELGLSKSWLLRCGSEGVCGRELVLAIVAFVSSDGAGIGGVRTSPGGGLRCRGICDAMRDVEKSR